MDEPSVHGCMDGDAFYQNLWEWCLFFAWVPITCLYCSFVVALVVYRLMKNERALKRCSGKVEAWQGLRYNSIIKSLIRRM